MVVIRQMNDNSGLHPLQPCSQSNYNGEEESQITNQQQQQQHKRRSPTTVGEYDSIEQLWETEGLSAMTKACHQKECKLKRAMKDWEKDNYSASAHGHGSYELRHDGHFAHAARPKLKHSQKGPDQAGETKVAANPRCMRCRDNCKGIIKLNRDEEGLQYLGAGKDGARLRSQADQAECFDSSFNLLTIEPRKSFNLMPA